MSQNSSTAVVASLVVTIAGLLGLLFIWAVFMHTVTVEPGHHAVLVDKPYFFGHQGARREPLTEGRILLFNTTTANTVRMIPQAVQVKFDDLSSADNILLDFESTIQYQFTDAVALVEGFGDGWFVSSMERQYMAIVRSAVKKKTMTEMMSNVNAANEVDNEVTAALQRHVEEQKLPLKVLGVSLGRASPNADVLKQMNETAAQQQRRKTLLEAEQAEIQREREQIARAKADNAYRNSIGMSPEQFIQLEAIKRYSDACAKSERCVVTSGQAPVLVTGR